MYSALSIVCELTLHPSNLILCFYYPQTEEGHTDFPTVILKLNSLKYLNLENQGIHNIPDGIGRLKKLGRVVLDHNIMLETLPSSLGCLPLTSKLKHSNALYTNNPGFGGH